MHVEVRRACGVREELAAGLRAAQGYGAPSVWGARATENFAPLPKHSGETRSSERRNQKEGRAGLRCTYVGGRAEPYIKVFCEKKWFIYVEK